MNRRYYSAYGSNLNREQMRQRCPFATPMGTAYLEDWRLLFKGSKTGAYLTIEPAPGERVPVAVWSVTDFDEERLDRYEGFPDFYRKEELTLTYTGIESGKPRRKRCFVYIMNDVCPVALPSNRYVNTCLEGYMDFRFSPVHLYRALDVSRQALKEAKKHG